MNRVSLFIILVVVGLGGHHSVGYTAPSVPTQIWQTEAVFKNPESVVYDAKRDLFYVSNVNGNPPEKDGNGFISKLSRDGKVVQLQWITGLNAPKGLALFADKLYIADIDTLVEIPLEKDKALKRYVASEAKFLNDVTAGKDGAIYVSDMMANVVYRLKRGKFIPWLKSDQLESPNGLITEDNQLIVASWGVMTNGGETPVSGHLKLVSLSHPTVASLGNTAPIGNLDGLESDGKGGYYATDWMAGKLYHINSQGEPTTLLDLNAGSADLDYVPDQKLIVIPMMNDNVVTAYKVD